jgi:hypothetical protein
MKIGIYDVDSKIPNLALMRISAFHKAKGDEVEHYIPLLHETYDQVYASKIFDFSDGSYLRDDMILGGTGIDLKTELDPEIDAFDPDYSLYDYPHSIGFAMRGCRFKCGFCVVPRKEGKAHSVSSIEQIWTQRSSNSYQRNKRKHLPPWTSETNRTICQGSHSHGTTSMTRRRS